MSKRVRFPAFERLSVEGQAVVLRGCAADTTQQRIQSNLDDATGEKIANDSLGRFVKAWRLQRKKEREAQLYAKQTIESVQTGGVDASELSEALIVQAMLENMGDAESMDLGTSLRFARQFEELKHKRQASKVVQRQHDEGLRLQGERLRLAEEQLHVQREKLDSVEQIAREASGEDAGKPVDPVVLLNRIRDVYGLQPVTAHAA